MRPSGGKRTADRKKAAVASGPKFREETPKKGSGWRRQSPNHERTICCDAQNGKRFLRWNM
jgi:hypothetical protein